MKIDKKSYHLSKTGSAQRITQHKSFTLRAHPNPSPFARNDKKRKYLFVLGEKEGKDVAIVWREYDENWNEDQFKEDKEFIIKELEPWSPRIVYVNGQSVLTPKLGKHTAEIRYIEPEFKNLMG